MQIAKSFLGELENEISNTRKLLQRVPFKPDWRPHERSMTLGKLSSHVAELLSWVTMTLTTEELDWSKYDQKSFAAQSSEDLMNHFETVAAEARAALQTATEEAFLSGWTMRNGDKVYFTMPKVAVIRSFAMNHLIHHRGQLTFYLRLLDVPLPVIYGPTADEHV